MKTIVSYGGGTNSTAMLIYMAKKLVVPDHILFADTGGERQRTYEYISYFSKWLLSQGFPPIEIVKYTTKAGEELTLEQDIINNNTLPAIAFGWKTCSQKFKIRPQEKFIKERYPDEEIIHLIGYDISEARRIRENHLPNHRNEFPLFSLGLNRDQCTSLIKEAGLHQPGKSSCFFCPSLKKSEIRNLTAEEKEKVRFIEANATRVAELKGLGRQYAWTDLIKADEDQLSLFDEIEMFDNPCECID